MSSEFSDASMDEAEAAIKSEQSHYQVSKGQRTLDLIGAFHPPSKKCRDYSIFMCIAENKVSAASSSDPVLIAQSAMPLASAEFSIVKDRVNNFVENSKILMSVLDEVGKAHPFIQGQFRVLHSAHEVAS